MYKSIYLLWLLFAFELLFPVQNIQAMGGHPEWSQSLYNLPMGIGGNAATEACEKGFLPYDDDRNQMQRLNVLSDGGQDGLIRVVPLKKAAAGSIVINEIMAFNTMTVTDEMGEYEDWIELYNPTADTVDLSGWYLSDNPANLPKWDFPVGTTMAPGSYLIIWADEDSTQGPMHANFKLSSTFGETVWLLDASLAMVDSVQFGPQAADIGYARVPNGSGPFVSQPSTFNANNSPTAIQPEVEASQIVLFPNPAQDWVFVKCENPKPMYMEVLDGTGRLLWGKTVSGIAEIPTADWANGMYFLHAEKTTIKFIITH